MQDDRPTPDDRVRPQPPRPRIDGSPVDYVFVEDDGSARDLSADELEYLGTPFDPGDGARPYIKWNGYAQLTPDGRIGGFLRRDRLPHGMPVAPSPGAAG